ncbi:MAG: CSLREA domain-containing protein, partial [Thermoflexia bacterium]
MIKTRRLLLSLGTLAGVLFLVAVLALALRSPTPARAQGTTITVNTDQDEWTGSCDDLYCSLREAIVKANTVPGTEPVTITFAGDYVITLTYAPLGVFLPLPSITRTSVYIIGDRNGDGVPDVIINGDNLTQTGTMGLWIRADNALVDGLEVRNVDCPGCWGLDIHGDNGVVRHSRFVSNTTGILLTNGASGNLITGCLVAWNRDDGILVSSPVTPLNPANGNTIANSSILSNVNKGIIIQRGASGNVVQGNLIAGNGCYGLHLRGGAGTSTDPFAPPTGNRILENEIRGNGANCLPQAGVVNDRTHQPPGDLPALSGGYDNLLAGNVITANTGIGIYNIGASPLITGNVVANNTSYGIYNVPDFFGTYSPAGAGDDILSIPILKNNAVYGNRTYAVYSLDTAPVDRYTLHTDNVLSQTGGLQVLQVWYGAVEVVTGTVTAPVPISQGISARIVASGTGWLRDLSVYAAAPAYNSGIWGDSGIGYNDVRTWVGIREFEVASNGTLVRHLTHTVQVYLQGVYTGAVRFSWDGLTATDPISGDVLIPQWVQTGPYGRYQVAEV